MFTPILIALVIFGVAHLTVDTDFPKDLKIGAMAFFIVLSVLYLIFGIF